MNADDLDRFYELIHRLHAIGQPRVLGMSTGQSSWPARGVYFFTEPGEFRSQPGNAHRIVRVGTHAVSANAKSKLWTRLRAHRGHSDGRGNHRGSIFRLHVGAALLRRDAAAIGKLDSWGVGSSAAKDVRTLETDHEKRVSDFIGKMSVYWIDVGDEPGPTSMRAFIEQNSIALLSNRRQPIDPPSAGWLGQYSPREEIQRSGLWNLNYVDGQFDRRVFDELEKLVLLTIGGHA